MTILEFMQSAPSGDYFARVQMMRFFQIASSDIDLLKRMSSEMKKKIDEARFEPDDNEISQAFTTNRSLLTGETFEECLDQYKRRGTRP